jgi:hypothetical protein
MGWVVVPDRFVVKGAAVDPAIEVISITVSEVAPVADRSGRILKNRNATAQRPSHFNEGSRLLSDLDRFMLWPRSGIIESEKT